MESKMTIKAATSGEKLSEVVALAKEMFPDYNLQTAVTCYLGFCITLKSVRPATDISGKVLLAKLIINSFEEYRKN